MSTNYHVAGIDLGTSNSSIAVFEHGMITLVKDDYGKSVIPSMISFTPDGIYYGTAAKYNQMRYPENTIYGVKRFIGLPFSSPTTQGELSIVPYHIVPGIGDFPLIPVNYNGAEQVLRPEGISSRIIMYLVDLAQKKIEDNITDIVITCPAYFNDNQRQATKDAGIIAGYNVLEVLNEPTAAAIAYGFSTASSKSYLIYDFGGGTFDATLIKPENDQFRVIGTTGDSHCGGIDLDRLLMDIIRSKFAHLGFQVGDSNRYAVKLQSLAETLKIELSSVTVVTVEEATLGNNPEIEISRDEFETAIYGTISHTIDVINNMLQSLSFAPSDIDEIVMIGGSSNVPLISKMLQETYGCHISRRINCEEAVVMGALLRAHQLRYKAMNLPDAAEGLMDDWEDFPTSIPIVNAIPLPIGLRTSTNKMSVVLPRYTPYSTKREARYCTSEDYQQQFVFEIYQGENTIATSNYYIGKIIIDGIEPAPRGMKLIEVEMALDSCGILTITVRNPENGEEKHVEFLRQTTNLTNDEIEVMRQQVQREKEVNRGMQEKGRIRSVITATTKLLKQSIANNTIPEDKREEALEYIRKTEGDQLKDDEKLFELEKEASVWNSYLQQLE